METGIGRGHRTSGSNRIGWSIHPGVQAQKSEECFIVVQAVQGGMADISDTQNSEFLYLEEKNRALNNSFYTYYAYIGNLNDEYALTVNGVRITPCQA